MNLKVCDVCAVDPRQLEANSGGDVQSVSINDRTIDLCAACRTMPFDQLQAVAERKPIFPADVTPPDFPPLDFSQVSEMLFAEQQRRARREKWAAPSVANTMPELLNRSV